MNTAMLIAGIGEAASAVRRTPCATHGWRPTSVVVQPAMIAIKPSGQHQRNASKLAEQPQNASGAGHEDKQKPDAYHDPERQEDREDRRTVFWREVLQGR